MSDKKYDVKCFVKRSVYVERNGKTEKLKSGVHSLSSAEYEHFVDGGAVTKDIPKDATKKDK